MPSSVLDSVRPLLEAFSNYGNLQYQQAQQQKQRRDQQAQFAYGDIRDMLASYTPESVREAVQTGRASGSPYPDPTKLRALPTAEEKTRQRNIEFGKALKNIGVELPGVLGAAAATGSMGPKDIFAGLQAIRGLDIKEQTAAGRNKYLAARSATAGKAAGSDNILKLLTQGEGQSFLTNILAKADPQFAENLYTSAKLKSNKVQLAAAVKAKQQELGSLSSIDPTGKYPETIKAKQELATLSDSLNAVTSEADSLDIVKTLKMGDALSKLLPGANVDELMKSFDAGLSPEEEGAFNLFAE